MSTVLIFERSAGLRRDLSRAVRNAGYEVDAVGAVSDLATRVGEHSCRAALVEVSGPEDLEWLSRLANTPPNPVVFAMGASPSVGLAVASLKRGARDYLRKPFRVDFLERALSTAFDRPDSRAAAVNDHEFLTQDSGVRDLVRQSEAVAVSDATVLILGEGGTGKKALAERIHASSPRRCAPLVAIDCASIRDDAAESQFFGREPDPMNPNVDPREGSLCEANGGTLLLEEVSEASPAVQALLLRLLEERESSPVGASTERPINCRILATSKVDLRDEVARGSFREDLFYRLDVVVLALPPLRERQRDIRLLADAFLERYSREASCTSPRISEEDYAVLLAHPYRGNVRELDNLMQRAVIMFPDREVDLERLLVAPGNFGPARAAEKQSLNLRELERAAVERSLFEANGNRTHASALLGINVRTLRNKIRAYGLS